MARPRLFSERASINIYPHPEQKDSLARIARLSGMSPSSLIRKWIDGELSETIAILGRDRLEDEEIRNRRNQ